MGPLSTMFQTQVSVGKAQIQIESVLKYRLTPLRLKWRPSKVCLKEWVWMFILIACKCRSTWGTLTNKIQAEEQHFEFYAVMEQVREHWFELEKGPSFRHVSHVNFQFWVVYELFLEMTDTNKPVQSTNYKRRKTNDQCTIDKRQTTNDERQKTNDQCTIDKRQMTSNLAIIKT